MAAFALTPFRPAWWLPGPHAQTVGARLLRSRRGVRLVRERVATPDGDFLDLDWADCGPASGGGDHARRGSGPLVLVLHGLEGSAASKYALELYRQLAGKGVAAVGLNFRSCSGEINRAARLYHSGETGDLAFVLGLLAQRFPDRALGAAGFSLGGNVLLKFLGERGRQGGDAAPTLRAAAAISVPFDLSAGADYLERGLGRAYRWRLVRSLRRKVRAKAALLDGRIDLNGVARARTFRAFDDAATAPLHGFDGAEDYYRRSSAGRFLAAISVPTLVVHSLDDPFLPPSAVPTAGLERNARLVAAITARGGHVGFVAGPPWRPTFWAEREVARFLAARLAPPPGE